MKRPRRLFGRACAAPPRESPWDDGFLHPQGHSAEVWSGWQHLVQDAASMGCSSLSAARVPGVPRTSPTRSHKPSAVIPIARGFGRGGRGSGSGENRVSSALMWSAYVGLAVTPWDESHHLRICWVPNWPIRCPISHVPFSPSPQLAKGHAGYQPVPSQVPVPPAGQGTLWIPDCPIPCPTSQFPFPPAGQGTHWVPTCPIPHPSS